MTSHAWLSDGLQTQWGDLVSTIPGCVCRKVKDMGPFFFLLQESEMSEMISLKMGAKFGTSLNMGEKLQQGSSLIMGWNTIAGPISCNIHYNYLETRNIEWKP